MLTGTTHVLLRAIITKEIWLIMIATVAIDALDATDRPLVVRADVNSCFNLLEYGPHMGGGLIAGLGANQLITSSHRNASFAVRLHRPWFQQEVDLQLSPRPLSTSQSSAGGPFLEAAIGDCLVVRLIIMEYLGHNRRIGFTMVA